SDVCSSDLLSFAIARPSHPQASSVLRLPARRNATASGGRDPAHASPRAEFARGVLESAPAPRASTPKLAIECLRATPLDRPHLHGEVQTIAARRRHGDIDTVLDRPRARE